MTAIDTANIFLQKGDRILILGTEAMKTQIPNRVYNVGHSYTDGYYLKPANTDFSVNYKVYDLQNDFIDRCCRMFWATSGNMGVLMNGIKGTGKTVAAKLIAKRLNLPVILLNDDFDQDNAFQMFLADIPQNVVVVIDEYEKTFDTGSCLL